MRMLVYLSVERVWVGMATNEVVKRPFDAVQHVLVQPTVDVRVFEFE